jgi:hypothetical protein
MADLDKVKRNVGKMVAQGAPEEDIDAYLDGEGVTVDQVKAHKVGSAAPPPAAAGDQPSTISDIAKSAVTGIGKGVAAVAGLPGDLEKLSRRGIQYVTDMLPDGVAKMARAGLQSPTGYPGSQDINQDIQKVAGDYHQPATTPGRYAETIASFLPNAAFPGSVAARAARVVLPGAGSEAGGEATQGTSLEPWARFAGAMAGAGVPSIARIGVSAANRATTAALGRGFLDPTQEATRRLTGAFAADGGLDSALERSNSFERSGASAPSVLDLGGGNVRRLVRASAGGGGPAETQALSYADRVRSNLQDNVVNRARQLTPEYQGSAAQLGAEMEANQGRLATEQYREPYAQPAAVTREMVSALQGPEGRGAINTAYATARANRDTQAMAELSDLRDVAAAQSGGANAATGRFQSLDDALANLSAGSLDRVRIAMREQAGALAAGGRRGMARGYYGRVNDIDTALDQTPGLTEARDSYRQMQAGRDSLETGANVLKLPSSDYAGQIAELSNRGASGRLGPPDLGRPLQVSARQAITDAVEAPTAGATGALNRIGTSNRATANLAATFGAERGGQFQEAVRNEVARLRNANFVSPESGSQTQLRGADEALVGGIPTSLGSLASKIADKIFRGTQLSPQEREAIVRLGLSEADIRRFASQAPRVNRAATGAALLNQSQANGQQPRQ